MTPEEHADMVRDRAEATIKTLRGMDTRPEHCAEILATALCLIIASHPTKPQELADYVAAQIQETVRKYLSGPLTH